MTYKRGFKDGLPIALGYVPVAFAFGVLSIENGFPTWFPMLVSLTNFTGTGQFVGTELIYLGATFLELFSTMLIINIRYTLMSVSLSQKLEHNTPMWKKLIIAFGVTDENYAVAMSNTGKITAIYYFGIMSCSFIGWVFGTVLGAILGNIFPASIMSAFGIALYAMFIAIIVPPATSNKSILVLILISIAFSCVCYFVPYLNRIGEGWVIIIGSIICTSIISYFRPIKQDEEVNDEP